MPARINYKYGQVVKGLTIIEELPADKYHNRIFLFECHCGKEFATRMADVKNGKSSSCGCIRRRLLTIHGDSSKPRHPMYDLWEGIKGRCYGKNNVAYKHYGGRGIKMCEEWKNDYSSFKEWMMDNIGLKPTSKHTLDRIDPDGNYEPDNLRWATSSEQNVNKRRSKKNE